MPEFDAPIQKQSGGGEVADLGVGAGFMAGIGEMKSGAEGMLTAAKSGGFRSDPEGVKQMVKICQEMFDHLERKSELFTSLAQEPKLGTSPYAKQVARHVASSGDGPQGVVPQLREFRMTLIKLIEALQRASGQYEAADETAKMTKSLGA